MDLPFKTWLPDDALHGGTTERVLRDVALAWSEHWFVRQLLGSIDRASEPAALTGYGPNLEWRRHGGGLAVAVSSNIRRRLAALMLDAPIAEARLNDADRRLLDDLAAACCVDLCARLADALSLDSSDWEECCEPPFANDMQAFSLGSTDGTASILICLDAQTVAALIKANMPKEQATTPLHSMQSALVAQPVTLSALLGRCDLALSDFIELAPGDVVVLDKALGDPLDLTIEGRPTPARCTIEGSGEQLSLRITRPLKG